MGAVRLGAGRLRAGAVVILVLLACSLASPIARAEAPEGFTWAARIDGRDARVISAAEPLRLGVDDQVEIVLDLDNQSGSEVTVRSVRLEGDVIGLTFFSYTTRLDIVLPPGSSTQRKMYLDVDDLGGQANGLIPSRLTLLDPEREELASEEFPVDVSGSVLSVYGVFSLAVAGLTGLLLASLIIAVARGTLPANRWQRALRFLPAGLGLGLTLTFTLSALRLLVPSAATWVGLVLVLGAAAFLLGYFLPIGRGDSDDADDADDTDDTDEETVAPRVAVDVPPPSETGG